MRSRAAPLSGRLLWNNITWNQLNATSALVKAAFPTLYVFYNEGGASFAQALSELVHVFHMRHSIEVRQSARLPLPGAPFYAKRNINHYEVDWGTGFFPTAIDYVSRDDYASMTAKWGAEHQYYEYVFKRMLPHQLAWVVPPVFNVTQNPAHSTLTNCTASAQQDLSMLDACTRDEAVRYLRWIDAEDRLVGMSAFHYSTYPPYDLGLVSLPKTLQCYQDLAAQLIQHASKNSPGVNK